MRVPPRSPIAAVIRSAVASFFLLLACLPAFAGGGAVLGTTLTPIPGGDDEAHRVIIQPDGKVVTVGYARFGTLQFLLIRYNADGTLDTTFNNTGSRLEFLAQGESQAWAGLLQSDGKIVAGGYAISDRSRFGIARFNPDGSLDTSFGGGGKVVAIGSGDSGGYAMALQSDGKILLGGYSMSGGHKVFTVVRFTGTDAVDTSYGNNTGSYVAAAGSADAVIHSMLIQSDGKVLVAGDGGGTNSIQVQRLNSDGTLDTTFGSGGTATFSNMTGAWDMKLQSDGKILIAGSSLHPATSQSSAFWDVAVLRANADGSLDTTFGNTFGNNGIGYIFVGGSTSTSNDTVGYGVAVNSNGTIVVSGTASGTTNVAAVMGRLLSDGSSDTSFGQSGHAEVRNNQGDPINAKGYGLATTSSGGFIVAGATVPNASTPSKQDYDSLAAAFDAAGGNANFGGFPPGYAQHDLGSETVEANGSVLQPDGKLVVVGTAIAENHASPGNGTKTGVAARYMPDGTLDSTFGTSGITMLEANSEANAVALQSTGNIVIGGNLVTGGVPAMWFTRVDTHGVIDTGFGTGGNFSTTFGSNGEGITSIAVQAGDDKIVAGGFVQNGSFSDAAFVRLGANGGLDGTFNGSGLSIAPMGTGSDQVNGIAIQGDGKIVGAGWTQVSGSQDSFAATRVNGDGTIDTNFGTNGVAIVNFGTHTSHGNALVLQPDKMIVIGGQVFNGTTDDFAIARLQENGTLDPNFGTGGIQSNDFGNHNRIFALALLSNGKLVGAGETGGLYSLVQYMPNGTLDTSFGTGGSVSQTANAGIDHANALTIAADGSYFAAGDASGLIGLMHVSGDSSGGGGGTTADISVSQSADPGTGSTGRDLLFAITVTNNGPSSASSIVVTDTLPPGWSFVWAMQGCSNSSNTVTCNVSTLASGQSRQFWVVGRPATAGVANNTVSASAAETDPNLANNTSSLGVTVSQSPSAVAVVRYRLYSPVTQEHLFTTDQNEYNTLGASGNWNQEGTAGEVLNNPGSFNGVTATPYYRLYNTTTHWHHWTTDPNEYYTLIQFPNWNAEGVDGFLLPTNTTGATQLYRLVYPDGRGLHHWTIDANEYNTLITTYGWVGEGGTGFVIQGP